MPEMKLPAAKVLDASKGIAQKQPTSSSRAQ